MTNELKELLEASRKPGWAAAQAELFADDPLCEVGAAGRASKRVLAETPKQELVPVRRAGPSPAGQARRRLRTANEARVSS